MAHGAVAPSSQVRTHLALSGNMEQVLTLVNAFRAKKVVSVEHPENGEYDFEWRGHCYDKNFLRNFYEHKVTRKLEDGTVEEIHFRQDTRECAKWKVTEWRFEKNFEDLYKTAINAYYANSFSPEERAVDSIMLYEREVNEDMAQMAEGYREEYFEKYKQWIINLYGKLSRVMSSAVTGPAKFPTERNRRANASFDNTEREFRQWREKRLAAIKKAMLDARPQEEKDNDEWKKLQSELISNIASIVCLDKGELRGYDRSLFVAGITGRLERLAKSGKAALVSKALDFIAECNKKEKKPIITERNKIWKLREVCQQAEERQKELENKEDKEIGFEGGSVVLAYSEDRLRIFHDEKPSGDTIQSLKRGGFRWSPANGCWQRQLTMNAVYAASRIVPLSVEEMKI